MAKANIVTPDGTTINLEGTSDEIAALVAKFGLIGKAAAPAAAAAVPAAAAAPLAAKSRPAKAKSSAKGKANGVQAVITEMVDEDFFKKPQLFTAIRAQLEQDAHFYGRAAVGQAMIRAVKAKQLRRIKQNGKWAYVV